MKPLSNDNHILVVEKPAGIATQPDFTDMVKAWVKKTYHKPGAVFLHPVHRLDKSVSGLVLFARTSKALSRLQAMMREHKIEKTYHALVEGELPAKAGTLVHKLSHSTLRAKIDPKGKEAILHYKVLKKEKGRSLVEIHLVTGRYHQIRIQLATVGCPIVGDTKYGSTQKWSPGIALQASALQFEHPVTKEIVKIHILEKSFRNVSAI